MKVLVVCQYYYPEPFRIHEVCEELARRGHDVTVLTGLPNYPMGVIPEEYKGKKHRDERVNGVRILRVSEIARTPGKVGLAKNYVSYVWNASIKALTMHKDFDVIFVYQLSPVLMAIPAYVAKWFSHRTNIVLYCLDLWPESLTSLGISKSSIFFKFIKLVSRRIYKGASKIAFTSKQFQYYFEEELGITDKSFTYIAQFADELFESIQSEQTANRKQNREFNYVFAGNIGEMQRVDIIIEAAKLTEQYPIKWHIVGDGSALEDVKKLSEKLATSNVKFYGRLPVEEMPRFYSMADAMIITLADNETISYTLPGKVQSYMAAGKAIIGAADGETENVISQSGCGMCAPAENSHELARIAIEMMECDLASMGQKSREYYDRYFSKESHIDAIEQLLEQGI